MTYVLPVLASNDGANHGLPNTKPICNGLLAELAAGIQGADFAHLILGEFGCVDLFAAALQRASLGDAVSRIVEWCAEEQVVYTKTRWIVALVKGAQPFGDRPVNEFPSNTVNSEIGLSDFNASVAKCIHAPRPDQARIPFWGCLQHLNQQFVARKLFHWVARIRQSNVGMVPCGSELSISSLSPLRDGIPHTRGLIAEEQVGWADTGEILAAVQDEQFICYRAYRNLPCEAVSHMQFSSESDSAVTSFVGVARPNQARISFWNAPEHFAKQLVTGKLVSHMRALRLAPVHGLEAVRRFWASSILPQPLTEKGTI